MREVRFIVFFAVLLSFSFINYTDGMFIFPFRGRSHQSANTQDDFNEIAPFPFPPFLNFFRPRSFIPYRQTSKEEKETKDKKTDISSIQHGRETAKIEELKVIDSFHSKINNVTGNTTVLTTPVLHHSEDFMKRLAKPPFFKSLSDPLSKLSQFRYFRSRTSQKPYANQSGHLGNLNMNETGNITGIIPIPPVSNHTGKFMGRTAEPTFFKKMFDPLRKLRRFGFFHSRFSEKPNNTRIPNLGNWNINDTEMAMLNSSLKKENENCSQMHFMYRYFYVWRLNQSSLALQTLFVLLLMVLVSLLVYICQIYAEEEQKKHNRSQALPKTVTKSLIV